jgi:hypothetical protein
LNENYDIGKHLMWRHKNRPGSLDLGAFNTPKPGAPRTAWNCIMCLAVPSSA